MKVLRRMFAIAFLALAAITAQADLGPLIPRDVVFGNPERAAPRMSPDAKRLAWLAPDKKNVLQVWVKTIGSNDDKMVTADKKRGIRNYAWAPDSKTILYLQDNDGDENFHVYGVDLEGGTVRDYTPFQGVRAGITDIEPDIPNEILVQMNARDRHVFDVYRLTLDSGALKLDTKNPGDVAGWEADKNLNVLAAQISTPDGGTEIRIRDNPSSPWRTWLTAPQTEIRNLVAFTSVGKGVCLATTAKSDTGSLVRKDIAPRTGQLLRLIPRS